MWAESTICSARIFFFQAEDGIRDVAVTGVQTCALPILGEQRVRRRQQRPRRGARLAEAELARALPLAQDFREDFRRSEERRVGKERRCSWRPGREKKSTGDLEPVLL